MTTDRHRQLCFASDPAGALVLAGDRVRVLCGCCSAPQLGTFAVARVFRTGAITVFDEAGKQRHLAVGRFVSVLKRGGRLNG